MIRIGKIIVDTGAVLAPMAGVTDRPFRELCRRNGAGAAIAEMVTSDPRLYGTRKTRLRLDRTGERGPRWVQILGADPGKMADAARFNEERGADLVDINLGCPAKKVCHQAAGSALLRDEPLIGRILSRVIDSVSIPVTLKLRTGWSPETKNAVNVARMAEAAGVALVSVHGRTRACGFRGRAEYETVRRVVRAVGIPVLVNGDITSPRKAAAVLDYTGAEGVMVGRAARGNPWLFRGIRAYLGGDGEFDEPTGEHRRDDILRHLEEIYSFYGAFNGVRVARKHLSWYCRGQPGAAGFWRMISRIGDANAQYELTAEYFGGQLSMGGIAA